MDGVLIKADGERRKIELVEGDMARLEQLQDLVGGYIEVYALTGGEVMVVNEDGEDLPANPAATAVARAARGISPSSVLAGNAVVVPKAALE